MNYHFLEYHWTIYIKKLNLDYPNMVIAMITTMAVRTIAITEK